MRTSDPRQPAYDAVFAFLRTNRARTDDGYEAACQNARVWRAVEAALDAMSVPMVSPSELYPLHDRRTCVAPGDQEHDHAMCEDVVAEQAERDNRPSLADDPVVPVVERVTRADVAGVLAVVDGAPIAEIHAALDDDPASARMRDIALDRLHECLIKDGRCLIKSCTTTAPKLTGGAS